MSSAPEAEDRLCDPAFEVSAHYLIGRDGAIVQLVDERLRAWHAGAGAWGGVRDVNSRSIGIELDNDGQTLFPAAQMQALVTLLRAVRARWSIPRERVIGHSDMAPGRKVDPGPLFDWRGLAEAGLSVWPDVTGRFDADPAAFRDATTMFGYSADLDDATRLATFRLRFFPRAAGTLGRAECAAAADLARRFAVYRTRSEP